MNTLYLDESMRTPGVDHLEEYRKSCFYPLLKKSVKERGTAYEELAMKILTNKGEDIVSNIASHGAFDFVMNGKKIELKCSRKGSLYDTRGRTATFNRIVKDAGYDALILMFIAPDDTVELYLTSFDEIEPWLKAEGKHRATWNLAKHPKEIGLEMYHSIQIK